MTATTYSYHNSNSQDTKSLFNMSIPTGLSTQLLSPLSPSLAKLHLGSYFSQPKSESETTSQKNSTIDISKDPTPIINNDEEDHNSTVVVTSSPQKKKISNKINRKEIDRAIAFSAYAVEEDYQGNSDLAMELYLLGLDHVLKALPIHSDKSRRDALKAKLHEFMDRTGLIDEFVETSDSSISPDTENNEPAGPKMSEHIIQAAVTGAVALKQSPIPDAISATVNYTMKKFKVIDEAYGLQDKAWEISRSGINKALEIDQQYNVHEKVVNGLFLGITAAMKAGIAYSDSPSYRQLKKLQDEYSKTGAALIKDVD